MALPSETPSHTRPPPRSDRTSRPASSTSTWAVKRGTSGPLLQMAQGRGCSSARSSSSGSCRHRGRAVKVNAPAEVLAGRLLAATVDIGSVGSLQTADYVVTFDPSVLELIGVSGGAIGGTDVPVADWNVLAPGSVNILQSLPTSTPATGSGPLSQLFFNATSTVGATSTVQFVPAQSSLTDSAGGAITTQWSGTYVTVIAGIGGLAQVVVNAPSDVLVDSLFTARVDIVNVENLNAASYHVVFDPIVVQLVGVTGGIIAGTAVPGGPLERSFARDCQHSTEPVGPDCSKWVGVSGRAPIPRCGRRGDYQRFHLRLQGR